MIKKIIIFLLILFQATTLLSQCFEPKTERHISSVNIRLKGAVKHIVEIEYSHKKLKDSIVKKIYRKKIITFNQSGNFKKVILFRKDNSLVYKEIYNYNSAGYLKEHLMYYNDSLLDSRTICNYNTPKIITGETYSRKGKKILTSISKYDKNNKKTQSCLHIHSQQTKDCTFYEYDKSGRLMLRKNGNSSIQNIYNEKNDKIGWIDPKGKKHIYKKDKADYTYDNHDNWTKRIVIFSKKKVIKTERKIEYY